MIKRDCWCSGSNKLPFSPDYERCGTCGTLISMAGLPNEAYQVADDESAFYGKEYWLQHQSGDLGLPNIVERSRRDLLDRNLHWLRTLLRYKAPPAKVLELGCSHGSFVALLRQAGYDASGMEMSPWVVDYAKSTFEIPVSLGPVEAADVEEGSIDVVVLMDVIEHLPFPKETLGRAFKLLKPDGILLAQMPEFSGAATIEELRKENPEFLGMLLPDEHLYLYSQHAARELFNQVGTKYINFERPVFPQHDMFFVASLQPIKPIDDMHEDTHLQTPKGRFVQGLLDQDRKIKELEEHIKVIDSDRAARLEQILELTKMINERRS